MARDLRNERKEIRNGNRYVYETAGTGVFHRDPDKLFLKYTNLRNKLYSRYKYNFTNEETRNELRSYIDEQFIILVKEYNINSPVDFPGYIKKKLYARVSQAFVKGKHRDYGREFVMEEADTIQDTLEGDNNTCLENDLYELLEEMFTGVNLSEADTMVLNLLLDGDKDTEVIRKVKKAYKLSDEEVRDILKQLRIFVANKVKK